MSRKVVAIVDDMFFASKIRATAEALGVEAAFPRTKEALLEKLRELKPDLVLVDLHNQRMDAIEIARELKSDEELRKLTLVGFFSHVEWELQQSAMAAGFDQVMPRSVFAKDLGRILTQNP